MKINVMPNKDIFLIFLFINAAGYNYENNPKGENEIRKIFKKKIKSLINRHLEIKDFIETIQKTKIESDEYIRLANLVILSKSDNKIKCQFDKISKLKIIDDLFQEYIKNVEDILDNFNKNCFDIEMHKILKFFNLLEKNIKINLQIHLNLLESYCRGTNYFSDNNQIISVSLDFNDEISWKTFRHEFMHILLKKIFKNNLENIQIKMPVNKNYLQDSQRVKFEENFILAANLFFIDEQEKRNRNLKYFYDNGYTKIYKFYSLIEEYFLKLKLELSDINLNRFIQKL